MNKPSNIIDTDELETLMLMDNELNIYNNSMMDCRYLTLLIELQEFCGEEVSLDIQLKLDNTISRLNNCIESRVAELENFCILN